MLPEIVDKFQQFITEYGECVIERVQELFPDLAPEEQQNMPIMQSDTALATCIVRADSKICSDHPSAPYTQLGVIYKVDVSAKNGIASISDFQNLGRAADDGMSYTEEITQRLMDDIDEWFTSEHFFIHPLQSGHCYFKFQTYDPNMMLSLRYGDPEVESTQQAPIRSIKRDNTYTDSNDNLCYVQLNAVEYSINAQGKVQTTMDSFYMLQTEYILHGLKGYPVIMNCDNDYYINKYITDNGAVNNYTGTYTTPQGKTINLYYGDNYIITNVQDNEPVSYNDVKNALNIAVDQINEDNDTDISVPDYPIPTPPDPDDDIEVEMDLNDAAYGAGMSHYYVTTTTSGVLDDISAAMSTWDIKNTGKDLFRNLLSCRLTKVGPIPAENSTFVIYGEELLYNGAPITISKITGNPSMDLGEYEILPKFNDFRDYAPYTKIEMYIPYCGWVALPSHCMSSEDKPKIITGTLLCDIIAGTCKAVIKCNDTVVAEAAGFTAVDVPFVGENVGMKMAGIASSITSYGSGAAKTVGGIAGGMSGGGPAGAAAAGGVVSLLGSYAQLNAAFNANYTEICGKTGDGCNVAGLNKVYIKIQRPKTNGYEEPNFVPGDYGHTTGFLCMQKLKVSDCSGLIIASNADVSGIGSATDAERAEIKRVLETGLFVNSPPESGE